ncbi:hypothetical protein [Methylobacterium sp. A54F]
MSSASRFPLSSSWRRFGWLAGLPALGLLWGGATLLAAPRITAALEAEAEAAVRATEADGAEPWLRVSVAGRDLVARGEAPTAAARDQALARLAALVEPRRIVSDLSLVEEASPFTFTATRGPAGVALSGERPAEIGRRALASRLSADLPEGAAIDDGARAARGAPPDFLAAASYAVGRLRQLAPGGSASLKDTTLSFRGEAVDVAAYDALRTAFADPPRGYSLGRVEILPPTVSDFGFAIERTGSGLVLTGYAVSEAARAELRARAAEIAEGAFVDDRTRTARGLAAGIDGSALTGFAARIAGLLQVGQVTFAQGRLSVAGEAVDGQAVEEIAALLRDARPAGVGAGTVAVTPHALSPYRVSVRREADSVTLSGHLPDAAARERVLAALRPRFFRERILDRTRLAAGAPEGLVPALEAAAPMLATLASGEVAVADRSLTLGGESLYAESARRLGETLPRALPPGWSARAAVAARGGPERREADACRQRFASDAAGSLRFDPGSSLLRPAFYPVLDTLAGLARACPDLRIVVAGHADPAPPPNAPKPAADAPAEAGAAAETPPLPPADKPDAHKDKKSAGKPDPKKADPKKADQKKADQKKPDTDRTAKDTTKDTTKDTVRDSAKATPPKPAAAKPEGGSGEEAPPPDLPRQRALAIVEYLLQAGVPAEQVAAAPAEPAQPKRFEVGFALR